MTPNWDFPKNEYPKLRHFEVQVFSVKNGESSVPLNEVISLIYLSYFFQNKIKL
jgi:hypothetical protein